MNPQTAAAILKAAKIDQTFWGKRIIAAAECGSFTSGDLLESCGWVGCACGKLDQQIPRNYLGEPIDKKLVFLGVEFNAMVRCNYFVTAAKVLVAIEKRAKIVLAQELKRRKKVKAARC